MTVRQGRWEELRLFYVDKVRPLLEEWDAQRVPALDSARDHLNRRASVLQTDLKVCFLGKAGVGKSTLLNSLLDPRLAILPQGGIGPLTAQAIVVTYSAEPFFEVTYHGRDKLNQLRFALEQQALTEFGAPPLAAGDEDEELPVEDKRELEFDVAPPADVAGATPKAESFLQQARLIVQGDQYATAQDVRYLVDGLRACLGLGLAFGSQLASEDLSRIDVVRGVLPPRTRDRKIAVSPVTRRYTKASPTFSKDLKAHAAGSLAALTKDLRVGWPSAVLQAGATLVDLPGVGIANDEYRRVTQKHVREARAVGIVVDRAGIDEASAQMLRETGFLNALLLDGGDEFIEPVHLFIAVVKLDLSADDVVNDGLNEGEERDWTTCFEEARLRSIEVIKGQLTKELSKIAEDTGESTRGELRTLIERLLASVEVHPIAATEYRKFHLGGARVKSAEQSYVPQLAASIRLAATDRRERLSDLFEGDLADFHAALNSAVALLRERARDEERIEDEVRALSEDFEEFTAPLRKELATRKGAFRTFLRETVPTHIEARVREATDEVRKELRRHIQKYRAYPWQTLRATIRRDGAFVGARRVNLPDELTLKFEEPVAIVWSKLILSMIRQRTRELGDDNVRIGTQLVTWTRQQGAKVPDRISVLLENDLRADTQQLSSVGKDAIDELKARVRHSLAEKVGERVRKSCQMFVKRGEDVGRGVKDRMHAFIEGELAEAVLDAARPVAISVLKENYAEVQHEVEAALKTLVDPIERAKELVVDREAKNRLNTDRKQRERLLQSLNSVTPSLAA